ncbi:MAG: ABC transporter permease [Clostridia bacterium]|nr:ABC transporter permease [Clostridia bacterium]
MKTLKRIYASIIYLFLYAPIILLILFSFNDSRSRGNWGGWTLRWYGELFKDSVIMNALFNTLVIALVSAVVATIIGTVTAFGMYYMKKTPRAILSGISYLPVMNPDIVTGVSLMLLFLACNVQRGFATLLIAHITFNIPYVILSVLPKLQQMNEYLFEASEDLGASGVYTFFHVIIPEIMPGIVSGFLLSVTLSIDDFVISFFTRGAGVNTLSVHIYNMAKKGINPSINALSAIMFAVVMILLIVLNKRSEKEETNNEKN